MENTKENMYIDIGALRVKNSKKVTKVKILSAKRDNWFLKVLIDDKYSSGIVLYRLRQSTRTLKYSNVFCFTMRDEKSKNPGYRWNFLLCNAFTLTNYLRPLPCGQSPRKFLVEFKMLDGGYFLTGILSSWSRFLKTKWRTGLILELS